ncbi:uncharacterized protein LOC122392328 [Amphibalanus amphitrite]|uniref:uncharacterized protein LOC122392328 n=1 Tax=Amphibalanus amphitrite TaxID=1232801 RepID=UPI001C9146FC|nr:uncharacterized protein LOC122392328 [Amphibalanus amphitrite]
MSRLDEPNVPRRRQEVALLILRRLARLRPGLGAVCVRSVPPPATACHVATYKTFITGPAVTRGWRPSPGCRRMLSAFPGDPHVSADTPCAVCPELSPSGHGKTRQVSGAPVSCPDPRSGRHRLVGIVAWSGKRGGKGHPTEFIRLQPFYRWIENHVTRYFRYHHPYFDQLQE